MGAITEIHLYRESTGDYIKTYNSFSELEKEHNLYRGKVYESLVKGRKLGQIGNDLIVSKIKYDAYPKMGEVRNIEVKDNEQIQIKSPIMTLTEEQLRQKHDMFFMVFSYIKRIPIGKFVEESQMLRELGLLGKPRYRDALIRIELKEHKGKVDGVVYYGHSESIKKLKQEGVLQ